MYAKYALREHVNDSIIMSRIKIGLRTHDGSYSAGFYLSFQAIIITSIYITEPVFVSHFRKIVYNDLVAITPEQYFKQITKRVAEIKAVSVSRSKESRPRH